MGPTHCEPRKLLASPPYELFLATGKGSLTTPTHICLVPAGKITEFRAGGVGPEEKVKKGGDHWHLALRGASNGSTRCGGALSHQRDALAVSTGWEETERKWRDDSLEQHMP